MSPAARGTESEAELDPLILHELSNVLTIVRTYTHFARQPTTPEQSGHDLRIVAAAAERGTALLDWLSLRRESEPRSSDELTANEFVSWSTLDYSR